MEEYMAQIDDMSGNLQDENVKFENLVQSMHNTLKRAKKTAAAGPELEQTSPIPIEAAQETLPAYDPDTVDSDISLISINPPAAVELESTRATKTKKSQKRKIKKTDSLEIPKPSKISKKTSRKLKEPEPKADFEYISLPFNAWKCKIENCDFETSNRSSYEMHMEFHTADTCCSNAENLLLNSPNHSLTFIDIGTNLILNTSTCSTDSYNL